MKKNKYIEADPAELKRASGKKGADTVRVFKRPGASSEPAPSGSSLRAKRAEADKPKEPEKAEKAPEKEPEAKKPEEAVSGREADAVKEKGKEKETGIRSAVKKKKAAEGKKEKDSEPEKKESRGNTWKKASAYSRDKKEDKAKKAKEEKDEADAEAEAKRKKRTKKLLTAVLTVLLIALLGTACVGIYHFTRVSLIKVIGCERYTEPQIIDAAGLYTGKFILTYDTDEIAKKLEADPYIDVLSVKRVFPDEIEITICERKEFAAIATGSNTYCVTDRDGYILYAGRRDNIDGLLPVYGLGTMGFSTGTYINADKSMLRPYVLMELLDAFGERDTEIASVDLTIPASLKLTTADGYTVMLGDSVDIPEKVERMFSALDKARESGADGKTIYINSSGTADLSGNTPATPEPTETPSPTEVPEGWEGNSDNPESTEETAATEGSQEP